MGPPEIVYMAFTGKSTALIVIRTQSELFLCLMMGMLIFALHCHLFNNMITYDHLYSLSTVQYYLFCRAGDEDEDDGAADGYVDIVFTLSFV